MEQQNDLLKKLLEEKEDEILALQMHISDQQLALEEESDIRAKMQIRLDSMANSTSWKLTKPIRLCGAIVRNTAKCVRLFPKGIASIRREGWTATWERTVQQLRRAQANEALNASTQNSHALSEGQIRIQKATVFENPVTISILVPLYNTQPTLLREMIDSVCAQTYERWELCLADGSEQSHSEVEAIVKEYQEKDSRIQYLRLEQNEGISANTNACASLATGEYLALLDHDDVLTPDALFEMVRAINRTNADVLYSDEDKLSAQGKFYNPFYKPDWSPDLLYSQMYVGHLLVFRKCLFEQIGGFDSSFNGSQDYDLMLRLSEKTNQIVHVPKVLYSWREVETSTAANPDAKPYAHTAGKNALDAHLKRKYGSFAHAEDSPYTFVFDPRFDLLKDTRPLVSIIIPMKDKAQLSDACVRSILDKTDYENYEILILDNRSEQPETQKWFDTIQQVDSRIRIINADFDFNWSKLNNFGMDNAKGEVYIFLNNDTVVISPDWLTRLSETALREDVGAVGPLLLYEDNTIQHAGIVVGLNGWADHVFKAASPVHESAIFTSPMINRNVLAVTGACMALSKKTIEKIGRFNEAFIVCGSDVEICLRAYEAGLFNVYNAQVRLYHMESKSRDAAAVPKTDSVLSAKFYKKYWKSGDPFYNINLRLDTCKPQPINGHRADNNPEKQESTISFSPRVDEIKHIEARMDECEKARLNLFLPSISEKDIFGGIATALRFYEGLAHRLGMDTRIIVLDRKISTQDVDAFAGYRLVHTKYEGNASQQIVDMTAPEGKSLPVRKTDIFMATAWWTAYAAQPILKWQNLQYGTQSPLIYLIQDYEPGFYPWSSQYLLADSTYKMDVDTIAVFNSHLLADFFEQNGYKFYGHFAFDPVLNEKLKAYLLACKQYPKRKKQILLYGRPSTQRNAFTLAVEALRQWSKLQPDASDWTVLSAGEPHPEVILSNGVKISPVGKLTLEQYAQTMLETSVGISLMVSPHPSYPPLEMSTFGIRTITNRYANKDLSTFNSNIVSVENCSAESLAQQLYRLCEAYTENSQPLFNEQYLQDDDIFESIYQGITDLLKKRSS